MSAISLLVGKTGISICMYVERKLKKQFEGRLMYDHFDCASLKVEFRSSMHALARLERCLPRHCKHCIIKNILSLSFEVETLHPHRDKTNHGLPSLGETYHAFKKEAFRSGKEFKPGQDLDRDRGPFQHGLLCLHKACLYPARYH